MIKALLILAAMASAIRSMEGAGYTLKWTGMYLPANDSLRLNIEQFTNMKEQTSKHGGKLTYTYILNFNIPKGPGKIEEIPSYVNVFSFKEGMGEKQKYLMYKKGLLDETQIQELNASLCTSAAKLDKDGIFAYESAINLKTFLSNFSNMVIDSSNLCDASIDSKIDGVTFSAYLGVEMTDLDNNYMTVFYGSF